MARRIFTLQQWSEQQWSEQPCVRPVCAVLMTAGHNALRGSGPGQKHAFEDAVAQVGCPDRRIDRRCIKCCSPSQPLRHAGLSGVIPSRRESGRFLVAFVPGHQGPGDPGEFVGERDRGDLGGSSGQQSSEPRPMPSAVDLGIADHGERAGHEQAPQIAVTLFADTAELVPTSKRSPISRREVHCALRITACRAVVVLRRHRPDFQVEKF